MSASVALAPPVYVFVCMRVCVCVCLCVCVWEREMYVCLSLSLSLCVHACVRACLLVCMHTRISATRAPKVQNHHTSQYQTIVNIFVGTLGSVHFLDYEFFLHGRISATRASINRDNTATHCNKLQHTATHCNTLHIGSREWLVPFETPTQG